MNGLATLWIWLFGARRLEFSGTVALYFYLQLLDLLTTLTFLRVGVAEANPFVTSAIAVMGSPWLGMLFIKAVAAILAVYCLFGKRFQTLRRANWFFAGLIVWNLAAMLQHVHLR